MTITNKLPAGNNNSSSNIPNNLGIGNIVPHWWYKEIRASGDKPNLVAITILSELYFLHRKTNGSEFNAGYAYFERKFDFTRSQLKDAIIRLDNANLAARSFRTIVVNGRNFPNELHLKINLPKLLQLKTKYISNYYASGADSKNDSGDDSSSSGTDEDIFSTKVCGNSVSASVKNISEHISIKEMPFRKNRSMNLASVESKNKSNFINNNLVNCIESVKSKSGAELPGSNTKIKTPWEQLKKKQLADFHPLSEEDCSILQNSSGRKFSLNAMNEILLDMSKRLRAKSFGSKKSFLSDMAKCLSYEMRDAVKINNTSFKIRGNQSEEERQSHTQEKYLSALEYSSQVSPEMHFKKKLAAVLESSKAYYLLTSYKQLIIEQNGVCRLVLDKDVNLTDSEQEIILSQLQAAHTGIKGDIHIEKLDIIIKKTVASSNIREHREQVNSNIKTPKLPKNIWGTIRSGLMEYYGDSGVALDSHWFNKLNASVDTANKNITLQAPTNFIKDWVQSQYSSLIATICRTHNYSLREIV